MTTLRHTWLSSCYSMPRRILTVLVTLCLAIGSMAQSDADRIVGTYKAKLSHNDAKIKVFKYQDGYRMQICWLKEPNEANGSPKLDKKNPDKSKRSNPMTQVVLIDKVTYEKGIWKNGIIYDPKGGRTYKVELKLEGQQLEVKGKLGPFHKCMYWTKIQ